MENGRTKSSMLEAGWEDFIIKRSSLVNIFNLDGKMCELINHSNPFLMVIFFRHVHQLLEQPGLPIGGLPP